MSQRDPKLTVMSVACYRTYVYAQSTEDEYRQHLIDELHVLL
jgi:hypothetical protein